MRSLFIKIFLWFWVANIVVAATAVVAAFLLHKPDESDILGWRSVAVQALVPQAQAALQVLEKEGEAGVFEHLDRQDAPAGTHTFLIDSNDQDLGGHRFLPELADLADRARTSNAMEVTSTARNTMVALPVISKDGKTYIFAREM